MKSLSLAILGAITAWILLGVFTKDFETSSLIVLILGIVIGYSIGKKEIASSNWKLYSY